MVGFKIENMDNRVYDILRKIMDNPIAGDDMTSVTAAEFGELRRSLNQSIPTKNSSSTAKRKKKRKKKK